MFARWPGLRTYIAAALRTHGMQFCDRRLLLHCSRDVLLWPCGGSDGATVHCAAILHASVSAAGHAIFVGVSSGYWGGCAQVIDADRRANTVGLVDLAVNALRLGICNQHRGPLAVQVARAVAFRPGCGGSFPYAGWEAVITVHGSLCALLLVAVVVRDRNQVLMNPGGDVPGVASCPCI